MLTGSPLILDIMKAIDKKAIIRKDKNTIPEALKLDWIFNVCLTEIINVSKTMNTPSTDIYLTDEYRKDKEKIKIIQGKLQYTKLEDIIFMTQIIYDNKNKSSLKEDVEFINSYNEFNDLFDIGNKCSEEDNEMSPWVLRIIFDKETMMNRNILMSDVQETIIIN